MGRKSSARKPFPSPSNNRNMPFLTLGSAVEARSDDEGFKGAWFVGKIVATNKRKRRFLIQYEHLLSDEDSSKPLEEFVDIAFVRPRPPPPAADRRFELRDVVDAFHRDGWWRGVVGKIDITEGEESSAFKYTVFFEKSTEKIRFRAKDMRFHLVWEDGKWSQPTKEEIPIIANCEEKSADDDEDDVTKHSRSNEVVTSPSSAKRPKVKKRSSKRKRNDVSEMPVVEEKSADDDDVVVVVKDSSSNEAVKSSKNGKVKRESSKRKRGKVSVSKDESPLQKLKNNPPDVEQGENLNVSDGPATEIVSENSPNKETEFIFITEVPDVMVTTPPVKGVEDQMGQSSSSAVDDQIPPPNFESGGHVENLNQTLPEVFPSDEGEAENLNQSPEIIEQADREQVEDRVLPFTKNLQLWEVVNSLDVLKLMPQKPHFRPLLELNEVLREGYAVGQYVNFAKLVEMTTKMRVNEPKSVFESHLKALSDLELHGFDVKRVVDRLKKLLSVKTRLEELENESKEAQTKIAECSAGKEKMTEEIKEIDEKISVLEAKRAMKVSEKIGKESERDALCVAADGIDEQIAKANLDFENEASAPW